MTARNWLTAALTHRAGGWILGAVFAFVGLLRLRDPAYLHDEGVLTWIFARIVAHDPIAGCFLQKVKPVGAIFYAPIAAAGVVPFLVAHVLVAALALPMIAAVGRALELRWPNVPPLVLATSPLYLASASLGHSNGDANVAFIGALYLLVVARRDLAAGALLGALPWIRFEVGLLALIVVLHQGLVARRRRVLIGAAAFPLVYWALGALYHHHLLWVVRWPPYAPVLHGIEFFDRVRRETDVTTVATTLLLLTPAIGLALPVGAPQRRGLERVLIAATMLYLAVITAAPFFQLANFDLSPRYAMQALPALSLAIARHLEDIGGRAVARRALAILMLVGLYAVAHMVHARRADEIGAIALVLVASYAAAVAFLFADHSEVAAFVVALVCLAGPLALATPMRRAGYAGGRDLDSMAATLERHPGSSVVYTNASLLPLYLARTGRLSALQLRYLLGPDQRHELTSLTNVGNGQDLRILRAVHRSFYGPMIDPQSLEGGVPADSLFLLTDDHRVKLMLRGAVALEHHVDVERVPGYRLTTVRGK